MGRLVYEGEIVVLSAGVVIPEHKTLVPWAQIRNVRFS